MADYRGLAPLDMSGNVSENWKFWIQKFNNYLKATELDKKDEYLQCAQLLQYIGDEGLRVFNTFKFIQSEKDKIDPLIRKFKEFFQPKKNLTYERYRFINRKQMDGEKIQQYVTDLKNKARNCELGDLEDSLTCSVLISGLISVELKQRLLEDDEIDLAKAIRICQSVEESKKQEKEMTEGVEVCSIRSTSFFSRPGPSGRTSQSIQTSQNQQRQIKEPATVQATNQNFFGHNSYQPGQRYGNSCFRCGYQHIKGKCPAIGKQCGVCGGYNHFKKMCKSKNVHVVNLENNDNFCNESLSENIFIGMVNTIGKINREWNVDMLVNKEKLIRFKLDTGAMTNVISFKDLKNLKMGAESLKKTNIKLTNYSNDLIPVMGECQLQCNYKNSDYLLNFVVVNIESPAILGLNTCTRLNIIQKIDNVNENYNFLFEKYGNLFSGIGCLEKEFHIQLKKNAKPVVHAARKIPFPLIDNLKTSLSKMEQENIIAKVDYPTEWVNSIVLVRKPDGSLRICLDPRDLNLNISREYFPLPTFEEITSRLGNAKYFSTLDALSGFWQIRLDNDSSDLCTFATPFGRYKFLRLPYGLNCAPEVFHKRFKEIFKIDGVEIYIDDILIWGKDKKEHDDRLEQVLKIAQQNNIKFNKNKCKFAMKEIVYMGHKISQNGYSPDNSKIKAITEMSIPKNKKELQTFLGMVTYVGKFIENLSNITAPLRILLKNYVPWVWEKQHSDAFNKLKEVLVKQPVLQYYDPNKPIIISADSSKNGVGAVLMQNNMPCMYASKALTETQKKYAQIEKELYSLVFACDRFHQFIFGKSIVMETDHKPLVQIFGKPLYDCPPRLQRMFIRLQRYDIKLVHKPGKQLFIADALSRAFITDFENNNEFENEVESQICLLRLNLNATDEKIKEIKIANLNDTEMQILFDYVENGWPKSIRLVNPLVKVYYKFKDEIIQADGLLYKNKKLIVPKQLRNEILSKIHYSHLGVNKCKNRARQCFFWPSMSKHIEDYVLNCSICRSLQKNKQKEPMLPHEVPNLPWEKVACDLFYLDGEIYLLVVDYFSKYIELVKLIDSSSSIQVITQLKSIFARHGIPKIVISDGGPQFSSHYFKQFSNEWQFTHIMSSPLYSQSNGLVEKNVQTLKKMLIKAKNDHKDLYLTLLHYRNTPIDEKIGSPAKLLMSRYLRDNLPLEKSKFKPQNNNYADIQKKLQFKQAYQKKYYDKKTKQNEYEFKNNENVLVKRHLSDKKWQEGIIQSKSQSRPRSYNVQLNSGNTLSRNKHFIQICPQNNDLKQNVPSTSSNRSNCSLNNHSSNSSDDSEDDVVFVPNTTQRGRVVNVPDRLNYS